MEAFIQTAEMTDSTGYDPVCGAAGEAYIEAFTRGASEEKAIEAAATAFLSAKDVSTNFQMDSHCGRAAQAFIRKNSLPADSTHPGTAAALAYISKNFNLDSCGQQTKAFIDSVLAGNSRQVASEAAAAVYQQNYAAGVTTSPACQAAEIAWKNAVARGQDPVLPAALAYMKASPSDSPCYVSATEYIKVYILPSNFPILF